MPSSTNPGGPVWAKRVGDPSAGEANVAYCAGRDVRPRPEADLALIAHDLNVNAAHAIMLAETEIVSREEGRALLNALREIRRKHQAGEPILRPDAEDVHMSIEAIVTELAGAGMGGRLHTGRSRNDQVATDMRLWLREETATLAGEIRILVDTLCAHVREHAHVPVPGITHMQPAMITTWGHWTAAYAARMARTLYELDSLLEGLEECPLGAAASYGSSWPTDRERTAELLGFARPTANTADTIWARGELEGRFAFVAARILGHLSGIGQDLILLSTPPKALIRLSDAHVTGSSIMPQKRNPDFAEVTRARAATAAGFVQTFLGIGIAAPMGYNRDTQWTKYLVMDAGEEVRGAPSLFADVFRALEIDPDRMTAACQEGFLNATDVADFLARTRGLPFRDCYRVLGSAVKQCEKAGHLTAEAVNAALAELGIGAELLTDGQMAALNDPKSLVDLRTQTGSPHPEKVRISLGRIEEETERLAGSISARANGWHERIESLWKKVESAS